MFSLLTFNAYRQAYSEEGMNGVGRQFVTDAIPLEEYIYLNTEAAEQVADSLFLPSGATSQEYWDYCSRKMQRWQGVDFSKKGTD